jgi:YidC/Oxa1 family membrane protein insertase
MMIRVVCATAYLAFASQARRPLPLKKESPMSQVAGNQRPANALEALLLSLPSTAPRRSRASRHHRSAHPAMMPHAREVDEPSHLHGGLLAAASMAFAPLAAFAEDAGDAMVGMTEEAMKASPDAVVAMTGMTEEAIKAANGELDWFGTYVKFVEDGLFGVHDFLAGIGFPYPYASAIFALVLLAKTLTFPLNYKQLEGSRAMNATSPQRNLIQKWYADDSNQMNIELGKVFDKIDINPLASILPAFVQIPILLGVYYASTSIAKAEIYKEGFLWIPSLIGPISDRTEGISWLTDHRFGLEDTLAYLSIPVILVIAQFISLNVLGSFDAIKETEKSGGDSGVMGKVLYALPFFLGWVAMSAPAALGLYWLFSNVFTTTITATIKSLIKTEDYIPKVDVAALGPRRDTLPLIEKDWNIRTFVDAEAKDEESEAAGATEVKEAE